MTIVQRDPATEEIIANRLESIVREMGDTILRTGRSIAVTSGRDFSCAIADGEGQLLAIGTSLPIHVLAMVSQMEELLRRFEGEIYPEDVFIGNDPFEGGSHLPDVMIGTPLFLRWQADKLRALEGSLARCRGRRRGEHVGQSPRRLPGGDVDPDPENCGARRAR